MTEATPAADGRLDFAAFLARFFPNRHRHNFAAVTAYAAYRNELEQSEPGSPVAGGHISP
jgi:hypothetical protein